MNEGPSFVYIVTSADDGVAIRTIVRSRMKLSRKLLSKLKRTDQGILLNGERVFASVAVRAGDRVEVRLPLESSEHILPEPIPFHILFEDEHLLVVNKAAGIIVHPTHGHYTGTLANGVVHHWQEKGETVRFRPVHRLDQLTSGALAIAKSQYVHQQISEQMKKDQVEKSYVAFVHGHLHPESGTIIAPIDRDIVHPHVRVVREDGYHSVTHYKTITAYPHASQLRIRLETGRTHQIRVHMLHVGAPLIGDALYGRTEPDRTDGELDQRIGRHALHAESLALRHPVTGQFMTFTAPWPDDMLALEHYLQQESMERTRT